MKVISKGVTRVLASYETTTVTLVMTEIGNVRHALECRPGAVR
jgi:hypothetical protein